MINSMITFIFLSTITVFFLIIPFYVDKGMTKECSLVLRLKRSTFKELKKLFLNEKWDFDERYPTSLFSKNAYYHAGIIRFGDIGYVVNIITYYRIIFLQRKIRKNISGFDLYKKPYIK